MLGLTEAAALPVELGGLERDEVDVRVHQLCDLRDVAAAHDILEDFLVGQRDLCSEHVGLVFHRAVGHVEKVEFLKTAGGDGYVHVLIEHQSSPDKHMAFRLIRYAVAAMQRHLEAGHKKLPLVIPVLFYTGKRSPYPYSTRWLDEFDDPTLAGSLYSNAFPLVDVTVIPDDEIADHRSMAALTLLQKHIHQRDLAELVDRLAPILLAGYLSSSQVISLVHYIVQAGETADAEAFVRELALRVPQHGDALMTIAQQLEQKGIEKGIQLGEQRGIEKGRNEGKLEVARTMLSSGIDRSTVMKMTGLTEEDLAQIRH